MRQQVDVDDGRDRVVLTSQKRVADDDGRVVNQHVHRAQVQLHLDGERGDLGDRGHVHGVRLDRGPGDIGVDQPRRLFVAILVHVHARHLGAQPREVHGQLASQAPAGAGDLYDTRGAGEKKWNEAINYVLFYGEIVTGLCLFTNYYFYCYYNYFIFLFFFC